MALVDGLARAWGADPFSCASFSPSTERRTEFPVGTDVSATAGHPTLAHTFPQPEADIWDVQVSAAVQGYPREPVG